MNKGGGLLVCTRHGQDRYKLESGCTYEDEDIILQELWSNCDSGIFEHIGLKSGGAEYYDPSRCSYMVHQPSVIVKLINLWCLGLVANAVRGSTLRSAAFS
jgi:hypothetical protein